MGGQAMMAEWAWPMMSGMWLLMLAFWILVIVGIIVVIHRIAIAPRETPSLHSKREPPLEILRKRYAAGEIDREQFERMKKDLES
jgi:putative membrane protein